jgi:hypothetical protein
MRRAAWVGVAAVVGGVALVVGVLAGDRDGSDSGRDARPPRTGGPTSRLPLAPTSAAPAEPTLLVWTSGGLPAGFPEQVGALDGIERVAVVAGDLVDLAATFDADGRPVDAPPDGMRIPLDAFAIDPGTYPAFVGAPDRDALAALGPGEALLGATSAQLRRLGPGAVLELGGGQRLTVAGVVADEAVGAAELVVTQASAPRVGITTPRFLLATYAGERSAIEPAIATLLPGTPVRFRAPGEAQFLRHADLVLPQALVKERFGEFAYAPGTDRFVTVDPAYTAANIVTATVPILGPVTCHREVIPALEGALGELERSGLASLVDPAGYQGCFVASVIPGAGGLSRHSWGIAIDVNFLPNPTGLPSFADPRLIGVMDRWGFIGGAQFLQTDPGHFEYVRPPSTSASRLASTNGNSSGSATRERSG